MTGVPASSHGGALPSQWTVGSDGQLTITTSNPATVPLTLQMPTASRNAYTAALNALAGAVNFFSVDAAGDLNLSTDSTLQGTVFVGDTPSGTYWAVAAPDNLAARDADTGIKVLDVATPLHRIGFFNTTPAAQPAASDIAGALATLGLVAAGARGATLDGGVKTTAITSGAVPTVSPVSGTAFQCSATRDVFLVVPVTFNPTAGAAATCLVQVSPDNVTFSTVGTETEPAGVAFDGTIHLLTLSVPAAWRVKLTVTNATLGTGSYY